jgi:hypothetical protein
VGSFESELAPGVFLTITEAASACRVHVATIRRAADARRFPNAYRGDDGEWLVPVGDLVAAGFPPSPYGSRTPLDAGRDEDDERSGDGVDVHEWRRRAEAAEEIIEEQVRTIEELRRERERVLRERDELLRQRDELLGARDSDPPTTPTRPWPDRR